MQYLLLIYSDESIQQSMEPARSQQYIEDYRTFTANIIAAGNFKAGDALMPVSTAKSVRMRDGERLVTDGPFAETREQLGGYYFVEAASEEEAIAIAAQIPTAAHGTIEVRPVMQWDTAEGQ